MQNYALCISLVTEHLPESCVLRMSSGEIQPGGPAALGGLFKLVANSLETVWLNSCYSEIQAREIANHIKYVIGMNKAVGDRGAITFAREFYQALGAGSIEAAREFGRVPRRLQGIPEHLTPVLFRKRPDEQ